MHYANVVDAMCTVRHATYQTLDHAMDHDVTCPLNVNSTMSISHPVVYTPAPCSPPYSPFGFCDYSVLDMMPVAMPVARPVASPPPSTPQLPGGQGGPIPYTDLTELHPYMHHMPYRPSGDESLELGLGPGDPELETDSEQQAALRRMMCAEPVIIQENERICVVRESGPLRTFTAM